MSITTHDCGATAQVCTPSHRGLFERFKDWIALARQRKQLANMDTAQLKDIGVTRAQANVEAARAPWDVPSHWIR